MRIAAMASSLVLSTSLFAQTAPAPSASATYEELVATARTLLKAGNASAALGASQRATSLDDRRWEAYLTAGGAYSIQLLHDDAISMLQAALARAPEDRKPFIRDAIAEARSARLPSERSRGSLPGVPELPVTPEKQPTLSETLSWLATKVAEVGRYPKVFMSKDGQREISVRLETRLDAKECDVSIESRKTNTSFGTTDWSRQVFSLAKAHPKSAGVGQKNLIPANRTLLKGPKRIYEVTLETDDDAVLQSEYEEEEIARYQRPPSDDLTNRVAFIVTDEIAAQRIAKALDHAVVLCRSQATGRREPF